MYCLVDQDTTGYDRQLNSVLRSSRHGPVRYRVRHICPAVFLAVLGSAPLTTSETLARTNPSPAETGTVMPFSSRIGGGRDETIEAIATDVAGNIYLAGWTSSSDIPVRSSLQSQYGGHDCQYFTQKPCGDAFLAKYDSRWNLIYSTFLGGSQSDAATDIAVDLSGSVYLTGHTESANFPGADPEKRRGKADAFVLKISAEGDEILYSVVLGGSGDDHGKAIAVEGEGIVHVTGSTTSLDLPTLNGPQLIVPGGTCTGSRPQFDPVPCTDAFVAKLDPSGSTISSTYLGGTGSDSATDIAVDDTGSVYVTGETGSGDFPTAKAMQARFGGGDCPLFGQVFSDHPAAADQKVQTEPCTDAFIVKIDADASSIAYSSFLGGVGTDSAEGIALDSSGNATVIGSTASKDFPVVGTVQRTLGGGVCATVGPERTRISQFCSDTFVSRLNAEGSSLTFSTYLGGAGEDKGTGIAIGPSGTHYIVGLAEGGFPVKNAMQPNLSGHTDAFVASLAKVGSEASSLTWSTYLGASGREYAAGVAVGRSGSVFVTGQTDSRSDFPVIPLSSKFAEGEQLDAFVAEIHPTRSGSPLVSNVAPRSGPAAGGTKIVITGKNFDEVKHVRFGRANAKDFEVDNGGRRITATSPRHSRGTVALNITTSRGDSGPLPEANYTFAEGGWSPIRAPNVYHHTTTVLPDGKVLVAGGCSKINEVGLCGSGGSRSAHIFDPSTETWKPTASLKVPRVGHTATLLPPGPKSLCGNNCGKVLVAGFMRGYCAELYDPKAGTWSRSKPTPVDHPGLHALSDKMCQDSPEAGHVPANLQIATLLPTGPGASCGTRCGNVLFTGMAFTGPAELFDPKNDSWRYPALDRTSTAPPPVADPLSTPNRAQHTATLLPNGQVLLVGGITVASSQGDSGMVAERIIFYDPVADEFSHHPGPNVLRYGGHTATLLGDGKVLVTGGMTDNLGTLTSASEVFDPTSVDPARPGTKGTWNPTGSTVVGRFAHGTTRLPDGRVVLAGGTEVTGDPNARRQKFGSSPRTTEIYDPAKRRWTGEAALSSGRTAGIMFAGGNTTFALRTFTFDRLKDGRLLVVGGKDAEIYTPAAFEASPRDNPLGIKALIPGIGMLVVLGVIVIARAIAGGRHRASSV